MADNKTDKKKTGIPPSLQPRKRVRKSIPVTAKTEKTERSKTPITPVLKKKKQTTKPKTEKSEKERFTLWLSQEVYTAFKIHVATRKGSGSDYIEQLLKKDLKIK